MKAQLSVKGQPVLTPHLPPPATHGPRPWPALSPVRLALAQGGLPLLSALRVPCPFLWGMSHLAIKEMAGNYLAYRLLKTCLSCSFFPVGPGEVVG